MNRCGTMLSVFLLYLLYNNNKKQLDILYLKYDK